ncbi:MULTISPECIES: 3'-5' exonuclease [unclassified Ruminococcus]|uniref:3'-5' exonuclease n=1 Tax=unclassified Ruminococcus TaxID=2608920 RepID=UPI00210DE3D9|nr:MULTISPECIES: 3'-5' exonuclease [unclassified Ruminococcus]MCQ4022951.1 exonuclease [Ruminococcus sp. zg-924]MCQ4115351.1 exonuclease [Ruminococcus sp. zg-921]
MDYVILDLEWNGTFSRRRKKYVNEIIDIGAVKLDESLTVVDSYSMLITPQIGKKLNKYVQELTHISIDELESAQHTFTHALSKFSEFAENSVILTWGTTDILTLMSNCEYFLHSERPEFLQYYMDLQDYCQKRLSLTNPGKQAGLTTVAQLLEIEFNEEEMHRALADSELSAKCFVHLFDKNVADSLTYKCDDSFYRRIAFKNHYITDINNPLIDRSELYALCPECGEKMQIRSQWQGKNRGFRAKAICPKCKVPSLATVRFKKKFDGLEIKHFVIPIEEKPKEDSK